MKITDAAKKAAEENAKRLKEIEKKGTGKEQLPPGWVKGLLDKNGNPISRQD